MQIPDKHYLIGQKFVEQNCPKFQLDVENFVRRKILFVGSFVQYFKTKVRQKFDKIVEILAQCRNFVQQNILSNKTFVLRNVVQ